MKYLKSFPIYIIVVLFIGRMIPINALDVGVNLAQLTTPTETPAPTQAAPTTQPSPNPSVQPSPTQTVSPSAQPSPAPSPTDKPSVSVTAAVNTTINPTVVLSPTKAATPSPTEKPAENVGGTDVVIPSPTPIPDSPTETPTLTPSPTPTALLIEVGKTDPPVQKAAEQILKKVVVPPLSFLLQRPQEDFYQENQITKPTSYGLMGFAAFGLISGIYLLFPSQIHRLYNRGKNKLDEFFTTDSNNFSVAE